MSRSVKMPTNLPVSMTSADPTSRSPITAAGSATAAADSAGLVPYAQLTPAELLAVCRYPGAAVASLVFCVPLQEIDPNVRRVVARAALGVDTSAGRPREVGGACVGWMGGAAPCLWNQ